jgi:methylmalonyl-CoA/ethylmalonyl-CoA epimerase
MKGAPLPFGRDIGQIIQYAYTVADIDRSMALYTDRFGVGPWYRRGPFTPPNARYLGEYTGMTISLARAFVGDTMIELIQQHDDGPSVYCKVITRGHGFHHWAVGADDIEAQIARFGESGYPAVFEDRMPNGARVVYVDATAELPGMIELLEMNDAMRELYAGFHHAAAHWDGADPVREG